MRVSRPELTRVLADVFARLDRAYATETWHWSPGYVQGPIDIVVGAVLVQHTVWQNAERALDALRFAGALDIDALLSIPDAELLRLIRIAGTPTVKATRLRALARTISDAGALDAFLALPDAELRTRLLATHGIGPESADAIALYAAGRRMFVIDAYTRRLFGRIGLAPDEGDNYEAWRAWFERALPHADATAFQRYHAHIVLHCKAVCRPRPLCEACPLRDVCTHSIEGALS